MTTLSFPANLIPNQVMWHLEPNTAVFVSPLTRTVQTMELAGARWVCEMTVPPLRRVRWQPYSAWLAKMRGQAGRVYFGPPHYRGTTATRWIPNLSALTCDSTAVTCDSTTTVNQTKRSPFGTPLIRGADQSGATVYTDGWVNDATVLEAGDYISYDTSRGRTLHMVVETAVSDGIGRCSIAVEPPIRTAPADNEAVETESPTCIMALQSSMAGATSFAPYLMASVTISLVEAF